MATLPVKVDALLGVAREQYAELVHGWMATVIVGTDNTASEEMIGGDVAIYMKRKKTSLKKHLDETITYRTAHLYSFTVRFPLNVGEEINLPDYDTYTEVLEKFAAIAHGASETYAKQCDVEMVLKSVCKGLQGMVDLLIYPMRLLNDIDRDTEELPFRETMDLIAAVMTAIKVFNASMPSMPPHPPLMAIGEFGAYVGANNGRKIMYSEALLGWEHIGNRKK